MIDPATAQRLAQAHALLQRGDVGGARRLLAPAMAGTPAAPTLQLAAMIERAAGDLAAAIRHAERAAAIGGSAELLNLLGNLRADAGDAEGAARAYDAAIAADPGAVDPRINAGRLASRQGAHPRALGLLGDAVRLAPKSVLARIALGNAQRSAGDVEAALATLAAARAIDPARGSSALHHGVALLAADRAAEAIAAFDAAERAGHAPPELFDNRAAARIAAGDPAGARGELDALVAAHPGYLPGHRARERLIWEFGQEGDPFASYATLAARHPREPVVWEQWLGALLGFRDHGAAVEVAARARAAVGEQPALRLAEGIALSETGDVAAATSAFEAAERIGAAALAGFDTALARHWLRAGDPQAALARTDRALAAVPHDQLALAYRGTAWRLLDDPREFWLHDYAVHVAKTAALDRDATARIADALRRLHVTRVHPADQSLRNGTQTPGALFARSDSEIGELRAAAERAVGGFIAALPTDPAHPFLGRKSERFRFAGSWSVRLTRAGFHISHVHGEGWISSAFYFVLPPADPADPPDAGALQLGAPPEELGLNLPPRRIVPPEPGALILFPSSMWHGTVPFAGDAERITAAFDVVPAPL